MLKINPNVISTCILDICSKIEANIKVGEKVITYNDSVLLYVELLMYNVKHILWSYENEFRCSIGSNKCYFPAKPSAIYMGLKCNEKILSP